MTKKKGTFVLKHISASIGYGLLFFFLVANILISQQMPSLYFDLINEKQNAMIDFLKQGRSVSSFSLLYPEIQNIFSSHEKEVYAEERKRRELIRKLEVLREQNPKSRDILYSLHLLYEKAGNKEKSQEYLLQAKQIDPAVQR